MERFKAPIFYLLVGFGVCIFLLGSSIKSNTAPRQFNPSVKSLVSKLEIIQTKMLGPNVLEVTMKNGYSKDITAVVAAIGDYKVTRTDFIFADMERDQKLSPGATYEFIYTIGSSEEENIVIKAVLFSDMTREGDFKAVKQVLDKRLGVKIQLARFTPQLRKLNKADNRQVQTEFEKVRQFAENLPIKGDDGFPMSRTQEFGLKHGKALILKYLSDMNNYLMEERSSSLSNSKQPMNDRYVKFCNYSLKLENDFKSLEARL